MSKLAEVVLRTFRRPSGPLGRLAGWTMSRNNRERGLLVLDRLGIEPEDRVLEVGFGPGVSLARAAELAHRGRVVGVDHSELMWKTARKRNAEAVAAGRIELHLGTTREPARAFAAVRQGLRGQRLPVLAAPRARARRPALALAPGRNAPPRPPAARQAPPDPRRRPRRRGPDPPRPHRRRLRLDRKRPPPDPPGRNRLRPGPSARLANRLRRFQALIGMRSVRHAFGTPVLYNRRPEPSDERGTARLRPLVRHAWASTSRTVVIRPRADVARGLRGPGPRGVPLARADLLRRRPRLPGSLLGGSGALALRRLRSRPESGGRSPAAGRRIDHGPDRLGTRRAAGRHVRRPGGLGPDRAPRPRRRNTAPSSRRSSTPSPSRSSSSSASGRGRSASTLEVYELEITGHEQRIRVESWFEDKPEAKWFEASYAQLLDCASREGADTKGGDDYTKLQNERRTRKDRRQKRATPPEKLPDTGVVTGSLAKVWQCGDAVNR